LSDRFTHLHLHSKYSLLDGLVEIDQLISASVSKGHTAVAVTDHGHMMSAIELYYKARENGLKPIIGSELYICEDVNITGPEQRNNHLTVLVKNEQGFKNLIRLCSSSAMYFYRNPRVDKKLLKKYSEGLIILSGCLNGSLPKAIINKKDYLDEYKWYCDTYGDDFYLEIQPTDDEEQYRLNKTLVEIDESRIVPTGDVHYLKQEDYEDHALLLLLQTGSSLKDRQETPDQVFQFKGNYYFLSTEVEMREMFEKYHSIDATKYLNNIQKIVDKVENYELDTKIKIPVYRRPEDANCTVTG